MPLTLILSVGTHSSLLDSIRVALQSAGFIVVTAPSVTTAIRLIHDGDFDLLCLDSSCSGMEREHLIHSVREFGSHIPILFTEPDSAVVRAATETTENIDPSPILASIREALSRSSDLVSEQTRTRELARASR